MINLHTEIVFNAYYNISLSENLKTKNYKIYETCISEIASRK